MLYILYWDKSDQSKKRKRISIIVSTMFLLTVATINITNNTNNTTRNTIKLSLYNYTLENLRACTSLTHMCSAHACETNKHAKKSNYEGGKYAYTTCVTKISKVIIVLVCTRKRLDN